MVAVCDRGFWQLLTGGNGDLANHARLVVARDQAGKVETACLVKGPDDFASFPGTDVGHVGLIVFHARKLDRSFLALNHLAASIMAFRKIKLDVNVIYG